jgi:glutamate-1-semialdehyde aminotransferase
VVEAVARRMREGTLFTLLHPLEVEVAERIVDLVPCAEMVRFMKNGSDATSAAIRLARAYTGRERVAHAGYHGWQDSFAATTPRPAGVPAALAALIRPFAYNRLETLAALLDEHPGEYAAVILEQPGVEPAEGFLAGVRDLAHRHGAVFIWDEIVTGFRYAPGGAQERYGVTPDLACLGKALGNGLPIAALAGCRPLMAEFERVFVSMTFGGDTLALAAARAVLDEIVAEPVIPHLWALGERWLAGVRAAAAGAALPFGVGGAAPRTHFIFAAAGGYGADEIRSLFLQECVRRGVLFGVPIFMSYSHHEAEIALTLAVLGEALEVTATAVRTGTLHDRLEGAVIEPGVRPEPTAGTPPPRRLRAARPTEARA